MILFSFGVKLRDKSVLKERKCKIIRKRVKSHIINNIPHKLYIIGYIYFKSIHASIRSELL